jgi:hypothetical protein
MTTTSDGDSRPPPPLQPPLTYTEHCSLQDSLDRWGVYTGTVDADGRPHGQGVCEYYSSDVDHGCSNPADSTTNINTHPHSIITRYEGSWKHGAWHGPGRVVYPSGDSYDGEWCDDLRHGMGVYHWADGRVYQGRFVRQTRDGPGRYTWPHGAYYEGQFVHNVRQGYGKYVDPVSHTSYCGDWHNGVYHGYGLYHYTTTSHPNDTNNGPPQVLSYRGHFVNGKPHGHGVELRADGSVKFDGEWRHGEPQLVVASPTSSHNNKTQPVVKKTDTTIVNQQPWFDTACQCPAVYRGVWRHHAPAGNGTAEYTHGDIVSYEGCFTNGGKYHGHGRLTWRNGDWFEGQFHQGLRHGQGVYHWKDGRQYTGMFVKNERHGKGLYMYPDSKLYEGEFVHGKRHGQGRFVFTDGSLYEGTWKEGRYDGHGTLVHCDGRTYMGSFEAGLAHGMGKEMDVHGKITYEGPWIHGMRVDEAKERHKQAVLEQATREKHARTIQTRCMASTTSVSTSKDITTTTERPHVPPVSRWEKDTRPCEAVVDEAIVDGQGNAGKYTGLVLQTTRKPHGVGRMVYDDGKRIHEGFWVEGSKEGHGRCMFHPQDDFHEGEYQRNLRYGMYRQNE